MNIRRANVTDAEPIAALAKDMGYPSSADHITRRLLALEKEEDHAFFIAEDNDGSVQAFLHVFGRWLLIAEPIAEIGGIVVSSHCRGQGIGRGLISEATTWARRKGLSGLVARSDTRRPESHDFYPKVGMTRLKTQAVFLKSFSGQGLAGESADTANAELAQS